MRTRRQDPIVTRLETLGFSRAAASRLSRHGTVVDLAPGVALCHAGERGTQAFVLLSGDALVQTDHAEIKVGPGDAIGEIATLDPHRVRNATVTTTTRVRVLVFDVTTYRSLAAQDDLRPRLAPERVAA